MRERLSVRLPSRRDWLMAGAGALASVSQLYGFAGKEFWNAKDPDQWDSDEVHKLLTKSPWAKEITGERLSKPKKQTTEFPRTPGIGGRSRFPGTAPAPSTKIVASYRGTVAWESAKPIQLAVREALPSEFAGMYVLSAGGIPLAATRQQEDGSTPRASRAAMDRVRQATTLQVKGHDPLEAAVAKQILEGSNIFYFGFAREAMAISAEDKEAVFSTSVNKVVLSAKFHPREMLYRGELAL